MLPEFEPCLPLGQGNTADEYGKKPPKFEQFISLFINLYIVACTKSKKNFLKKSYNLMIQCAKTTLKCAIIHSLTQKKPYHQKTQQK
jgi:hypothetical protein